MPSYMAGARYPGNWMYYINKALWLGIPRPVGYVFVTFLGFFLLLRVMKVNPWLSAIGAAAYAFSSYFFIIHEAGHTSKANAISFMAPVIAGILLTYRGKWLIGGALTALAVALQVNANHLQITYYLAIAIAMLGIAFLIDAAIKKTLPDFAKYSAILLLAAMLGVGPNVSRLWTASEYAAETLRGKSELPTEAGQESGLDKEYALRWSYGVSETLTLLIPDAFGGSSGVKLGKNSETAKEIRKQFGNTEQVGQVINQFPGYWGDQPFTSGPVYVGAIVCFLFVLGLILVEGPLKWWALAATLLFTALSWGRHFAPLTDLFFDYFPLYNKFRAVSMMLVIAEFTLPLLGVLALQKIMDSAADKEGNSKRLIRAIAIAAGVTGGLALLLALLGPALFSFEGAQDDKIGQLADLARDYRISALRNDAFRSAFFIAAAAALVFAYVKRWVQPVLVYAGLGMLVLLDMVPVDLRYINSESYVSKKRYDQAFVPSAASNFILQDKDPNYRVLNMTTSPFDDALTSYHHKSIGGYHAAKLRRYQDVISQHIQPEMQLLINALQNQPTDSSIRATFSSLDVLNMLNMRYVIYNPKAAPLQNASAFGNAWFASTLKKVNSPEEEITALGQGGLRTTAVVDVTKFPEAASLNLSPDSTARIGLSEWEPVRISYETQSQSEGLAVFSEVYYSKGWQAYLDGQPVDHLRANYVLRALKVPAGKHTVEFRFEPRSYAVGEQISLACSALLLLLLAAACFLEFRKPKDTAAS
ncbi:MAG: hypothetical protein EAZ89_07085 [Bacteroidetes bacterium]|nr:MAG: hypothetical protein EAZ89_07085 [Bacteroidota bacterium]